MTAPFNAESHLPKLEYDLSAFQRNDDTGRCRGSGVFLEPTPERLCAWATFARTLRRPPLPSVATRFTPEKLLAKTRTAIVDAISALGGGSPARSELEELPDRVLFAFARWLEAELEIPEAVGI